MLNTQGTENSTSDANKPYNNTGASDQLLWNQFHSMHVGSSVKQKKASQRTPKGNFVFIKRNGRT